MHLVLRLRGGGGPDIFKIRHVISKSEIEVKFPYNGKIKDLRAGLSESLKLPSSKIKLYYQDKIIESTYDEYEVNKISSNNADFTYFAISYYNIIFC